MSGIDGFISGEGAAKVVLALTRAENLANANCEIIKKSAEAGNRSIVITMNNPSPLLKDLYRSEGIDISNVYFIDAITKYALGSLPGDIDNSVFVTSPSNLTDIGISVTEMLKENSGEKTIVLLDSVNTMLIYMPTPTLTKFMHFMSSKLRLMKCTGFYLSVKEGLDPVLLMQLKTFSDSTEEI
ncbi:hypothetical protein [Methanoplanus limicola]|uniref:KaiC-like domain-containing protein n=1 Tax=Methanoplanus limicola DSM 2279 TaxID=937775 RepID=H1YYY2_9EURY|nr:hypothetical protein [Methanoplanus limicola]EHQ37054.1 hypothetical protein Metlim_3022 [Methanoplanus limicola DSM 2279]